MPTSTATPTATATPPEGCLVDPFGAAGGFNLYVLGDADLVSSDIQGKAAVCGDASLLNYSVGDAIVGLDDVLVVGNDVTFQTGTVHGNLTYGGTATLTSVNVTGTASQSTPLDCNTTNAQLLGLSSNLCGLSPSGSTQLVFGTLVFAGNEAVVNVFTVTAADLAAAHTIRFLVPAGSTVLVNVVGSPAVMSNAGFQLGNATNDGLVFNFCDATTLAISAIGVPGTILAPQADVTFNAGDIFGALIAGTMSGGGQFHDVAFTGCLGPQPTPAVPTPTPPTATPTAPAPTNTPGPSNTPAPSHTPAPTNTPAATNTPVPPTSTATPSPTPDLSACIDNPLGVAADYNVFLFGDASLAGSDTEGRFAAAGNVNLQGYSVGSRLVGISDALVVGGDVTFSAGTVHGNLVYGGAALLAPNVTVTGATTAGNPIDFVAAATNLEDNCATLAARPVTGSTTFAFGVLTLSGTEPLTNVFAVDAADLAVANTLALNVPAGSTVLVNVFGAGTFDMSYMGFSMGGTDPRDVLFTMCDADALTMAGVGVMGSILAPNAAVDFRNGQLNGTLVAGSLTGTGQPHDFPFAGCIVNP